MMRLTHAIDVPAGRQCGVIWIGIECNHRGRPLVLVQVHQERCLLWLAFPWNIEQEYRHAHISSANNLVGISLCTQHQNSLGHRANPPGILRKVRVAPVNPDAVVGLRRSNLAWIQSVSSIHIPFFNTYPVEWDAPGCSYQTCRTW